MDQDPPASSSGTMTNIHIPFGELGLTPFTPSKQHIVARLDTIIFDKSRKTITRRLEKRLKMGTQVDIVTVTECTIMEGTHKDPKFMASVNIAAAQASADNVYRLMDDVERNKENMLKLKDSLVKLWGEGIDLKRKHDAILSKKERILSECRTLETEKEEMNDQLVIMEGERNDFKARISQLESRESTTSQQVE